MNAPVRAVLFDLGGTLYDYRSLEPANREGLLELAARKKIRAEPAELLGAYRESMRRAFNAYLPKAFYLHRDLFFDALSGMLEGFGLELSTAEYALFERELRERQRRDLELREGVIATLQELRERGAALGIVSNIDEDQLMHLTEAGRLRPHFDWMLSSEAVRSCKPDPGIFAAALERSGCAASEVLFVGDTLRQDIAGANAAGMRSVLLWHRPDRPAPAPDANSDPGAPAHVISAIPDLLGLVT